MAYVNKRVIFLKEGGAVAGTFTLSEISGRIYVKCSVKGGVAAFEGDSLPLTLIRAEDLKNDYDTGLRCAIGSEISVIVFEKAHPYKITAYGCCGRNAINADILLGHCKKRMIGGKIITPPEITESAAQEKEAEHKTDGGKNEYRNTYDIIKSDSYTAEDTTLADIDIIAEENYYEIYNKEIYDSLTEKEKRQISEAAKSGERDGYKYVSAYINNGEQGEEQRQKEYIPDYGAGSYYGDGGFYTEEEYGFESPVTGGGEKAGEYIKESGGALSYGRIKNKLLKLLSENERDNEMCRLIPECDFVRVYYGEDSFYSVGLIRENGTPRYVCYAVPSERYGSSAAEEFIRLARWIPSSHEDIRGKGYYAIFRELSP